MESETLAATDAAALLETALELTVQIADLEERRAKWIDWLLQQIGADGGLWCLGRGNPLARDVTPIATIVRGFTSEEWFAVVNAGLSEEADQVYRLPYVPYLEKSRLVCLSRSMVWSDAKWTALPFRRLVLKPVGFENWLIGVRYVDRDTWCCLSMHRRFGRPDFSPRDVVLTKIALGGIGWLSAQPSEAVPDQAFAELTRRQRMVMLCLLDGLPRKEIASRLGITQHTVNDHVKAIFDRFQVSSISELASYFLKTR